MTLETANKIKEYRKKHGLTQEKLAQILGVAHNTVARWEAGDREPRGLYAKRLQEVLNQKEE